MRIGDGGGEVVSAVPDALMGYANVATPNDKALQGYGNSASAAIQNFLRSNPDPSVMAGIPDVGADAAAFGAQKGALDQWVFDVGLAFLTVAEQNLPPAAQGNPIVYDPGQSVVTPPGGQAQLQAALTNNALTDAAKQNADALSKLLAFPNDPLGDKSQFLQLIQALQSYGNDPIQLAAFFQKLGAKNTLLAAQYLNIMDPKAIPAFSSALATATNSPTWNNSFDKSLVNTALDGQDIGPQGQPISNQDLSLLLQSGVFSNSFLTTVGDTLIPYPGHVDEEHAGLVVPAFLQALARNPQAAFNYLTGAGPDTKLPGQQPTRLGNLELMKAMFGATTGPPPDSWMNALGAATLAANSWAGASASPQGSDMALLKALANSDWQDVPDPFRNAVLQVVSQHVGDFINTGGQGELTQEEQQSLLALALTDGSGGANQDKVTAFQSAIVRYVGTNLRFPDSSDTPAVQQWIDEVAKLSALPLLGEQVGSNANEKAKAQSLVFLQLLFAVAGAFQPELEPEALGLSVGATKVLNALLDFGEDKAVKEPLEEKLLNVFYPDGGVPKDIQTGSGKQQAEGQLTVASLLYAKNPAWLPGSPDPTAARAQIAKLVEIANTNEPGTLVQQETDFANQHPGYTVEQVNQLVVQLQAIGGQYAKDATPSGG